MSDNPTPTTDYHLPWAKIITITVIIMVITVLYVMLGIDKKLRANKAEQSQFQTEIRESSKLESESLGKLLQGQKVGDDKLGQLVENDGQAQKLLESIKDIVIANNKDQAMMMEMLKSLNEKTEHAVINSPTGSGPKVMTFPKHEPKASSVSDVVSSEKSLSATISSRSSAVMSTETSRRSAYELIPWPTGIVPTKTIHLPDEKRGPDKWTPLEIGPYEVIEVIMDDGLNYTILPSDNVPVVLDSWVGNDSGCYKYEGLNLEIPKSISNPLYGKERMWFTLKKPLKQEQIFGVKPFKKNTR